MSSCLNMDEAMSEPSIHEAMCISLSYSSDESSLRVTEYKYFLFSSFSSSNIEAASDTTSLSNVGSMLIFKSDSLRMSAAGGKRFDSVFCSNYLYLLSNNEIHKYTTFTDKTSFSNLSFMLSNSYRHS